MVYFQSLTGARSVNFSHGRGEPVVVDFPADTPVDIECEHCVMVLDRMPGFERT